MDSNKFFELFWNSVGKYNDLIFPLPFIMFGLSFVLVFLVANRPGKFVDIMTKSYFIISFSIMGVLFPDEGIFKIIYSVIYFSMVLLFILDIYHETTKFALPEKKSERNLSIVLIAVCPVIYIAVEYFVYGFSYPKMVITGTAPCPTFVFLLLLMAASVPRINRKIYFLSIFVAIVDSVLAMVFLDFEIEILLTFSGIYSVYVLLKHKRENKGIIGDTQK